jgi:hypothetical protein
VQLVTARRSAIRPPGAHSHRRRGRACGPPAAACPARWTPNTVAVTGMARPRITSTITACRGAVEGRRYGTGLWTWLGGGSGWQGRAGATPRLHTLM